MKTLGKGLVTAAAIVAAAGAGLWAGQNGVVKLPTTSAEAESAVKPAPTGPVVYYRDPTGKPFYSLEPKASGDGQHYLAIHASEDVSFDLKRAGETKGADATHGEKKIKYYRNPMGLPDTSPVPKKDSMGMDYIPVYEGEESDDSSFKVSPGKIQRSGVETVEVAKRPITRTVQAPGAVQFDERRITVVAPRFDGYVVNVGAPTSGTRVKQGDALVTLFGQELLNWGARLIIEQGYGFKPTDEAFTPPGLKSEGSGVIGARRRLENLGAPQEFVDAIKDTRRVPNTITFRAPIDGVILERNIVNGQAFKAGDVLFRLADLSVVWMMADVAEGDIDAVKPGQTVRVTTRAYPGRIFEGRVGVIYPQLTKETRTARVRVELPNPNLALLPDMYGNVEIKTGGNAPVLTVPSSAVIDSGNRQVVLLERGDGRYEPRDVKIGRRGDGYVELISGVAEGDRVVANGNFLIDAESNLQSALKGLEKSSSTEAIQ